jgi:hypothetical protein
MRRLLIVILAAGIGLLGISYQRSKQLKGRADSETVMVKVGGIDWEKIIGMGEEAEVNFRMRDYKNLPRRANLPAVCESGVKDLIGKVALRVWEIGKVDKLGEFVAKEGMTYYYAIYDYKGSEFNPKGQTIEPSRADQTGLDWAPQIVAIIGEKEKCMGEYNNELKRERGLGLTEASMGSSEWTTQAAVWYEAKNDKAVWAIKYIDPTGKIKYIGIKE